MNGTGEELGYYCHMIGTHNQFVLKKTTEDYFYLPWTNDSLGMLPDLVFGAPKYIQNSFHCFKALNLYVEFWDAQ